MQQNSATVIVRKATDADATALQRFAADLIGERLPVLFRRDHAPAVEDQREMIQRLITTPRSVLLVAESNGIVVGMLDFHGHKKPQRSHAGEFGMSVAKVWRSRGVGSRLLAHLFDWAGAEGICRLELTVFSNNTSVIALYGRRRFVVEGTQRDAVEVDGGYVDLILMAKIRARRAAVGFAE